MCAAQSVPSDTVLSRTPTAEKITWSPIALRVPFHDAGALADHEAAGRLLIDRNLKDGAGEVATRRPQDRYVQNREN